MGAVYLAEHTHMKKRVALKLLHPEMAKREEVLARFRREAEAAAHVEHPNIVAATDFGQTEDGAFFLVLEYVDGTTLRDDAREGPVLARARAPRRASDRACARPRSRSGHRASRSQARERDARHEGRGPRLREGPRLRRRALRPSVRCERGASHAARDGHGNAAVHGAGAGRRRPRDPSRRSLRARLRALRDADGRAPVQRRPDAAADDAHHVAGAADVRARPRDHGPGAGRIGRSKAPREGCEQPLPDRARARRRD